MKFKTIIFCICVVGSVLALRPFKSATSAPRLPYSTTVQVNGVSAPSILVATGTPLTLTVETDDPTADCTVITTNMYRRTLTETVITGSPPLTMPINTTSSHFTAWTARCTHADTVSMAITQTRVCPATAKRIPTGSASWGETRISVSGAEDPCNLPEIVPGEIAADSIYWVHRPWLGLQLINPCISHRDRAGDGNILKHTWGYGRDSFCYDALDGGFRRIFQDNCELRRNQMGFLAEPLRYSDGCMAPCNAGSPDGRYCTYPCPPVEQIDGQGQTDETAETVTYPAHCQLPDEWKGQCPPSIDFDGNIVDENPSLCGLRSFNEDEPDGYDAEQELRDYIRSIPYAIWLIGNETDWIWEGGLIDTVEFDTGETIELGGATAYAKFYAAMYDMIKTEYEALPDLWRPRLVFCQASKAGSNGEDDVEGLNYCRAAYDALPSALTAVNPTYAEMDAAEAIYALGVHQYFPTFGTNDGSLLTAELLQPTMETDWIAELQQFEQWATDAGLGDKPLWLTEFGALRAWCPESLPLQARDTGDPCDAVGRDNLFYGRNNTEGLWGLQKQQMAYLQNHDQWKMAWWYVGYNTGGALCNNSGGIWGYHDVTSDDPYHFDCRRSTFYVYDHDEDGKPDVFRRITVDLDQDGVLDPVIDSNHDGVIDPAVDTTIDADGDGEIDLTIMDRGVEYNLDANYEDGRPDIVYIGINRLGHTLRCVLMGDEQCTPFEPSPLVTFTFEYTLFLPVIER